MGERTNLGAHCLMSSVRACRCTILLRLLLCVRSADLGTVRYGTHLEGKVFKNFEL